MKRFTLNTHGGRFCALSPFVGDPANASLILGGLASDWEGKAYLRRLMHEHRGGRSGVPLSDRALLRRLAGRLALGELEVVRVAPVHAGGGGGAGEADATHERPEDNSPPPSKREAGPSVAPSDWREPTDKTGRDEATSEQEQDWNTDAQIAALIAAAESGAAFCEQCASPPNSEETRGAAPGRAS